MTEPETAPPAPVVEAAPRDRPEPAASAWQDRKRVLVLQGGGALGSYQAGVCEAMDARGLPVDWVAGISIGAINAAIIAGNPPHRRAERLREFWDEVSSGPSASPFGALPVNRVWANQFSAGLVTALGVPGFFSPHWMHTALAALGIGQVASYYDTAPLRATLERLVDFDRVNGGDVRLSVGAVDVESGNSVVFDTSQTAITPEHIMASGALPPGLPPVAIGGRHYWDGGLLSNTPLQFVLDEERREDLLILQVDLFPAHGPLPQTLADVNEREKDIRYSSRTRANTHAAARLHQLKLALRRVLDALPDGTGDAADVALLRDAAKENAVAVVQLVYRKRPYEGGLKDYEFSRPTMLEHWNSGRADAARCMDHVDRLLADADRAGMVVIDPGLHDDPAPTETQP